MKIKSYSKTVSTGNLIRHLRDDHGLLEDYDADKMAPKKGNSTARALVRLRTKPTTSQQPEQADPVNTDKSKLTRDLVLWFCQSLLPFDYVSDKGMVDFFKMYNIIARTDDFPSRHIISTLALDDMYGTMLTHVKETLQLNQSADGALSFDFWTDIHRQRNYLTSTYHFLKEDFDLKSFTLLTSLIDGDKTGQQICDIINKLKSNFGLQNKSIFAVTNPCSSVQHAVSSDSMNGHLCLGHGLHNLVTADGIPSVPEICMLIRKLAKIIRFLHSSLIEIEDAVENDNKALISSIIMAGEYLANDKNDPRTGAVPSDDLYHSSSHESDKDNMYIAIPSRWHSILQMLESLNQCSDQIPVNNLLAKIGKDELSLDHNDWKLMTDLNKLLKKIKEAVEIMSSQETSSLNVALVFRSEIKYTLRTLADDESMVMRSLKNNMLAKLDQRFPVTKLIIAATLLDCRFQGIQEVDEYLRSNSETRVSFLSAYIKEVVKKLDVEGVEENKPSSSLLIKLSRKHSQMGSPSTKDQIEEECWKYFVSSNPHSINDGDLLKFWYSNMSSFPWLAALARSVLCIPATSIPSERIFSNKGMELTAKRCRLNPNDLNKMMFIHDNYKYCKANIKS